MNFKKMCSIVEEIVFFEYLQKIAGNPILNAQLVEKLFREFLEKHKNTFTDIKSRTKVDYSKLPINEQRKVWDQSSMRGPAGSRQEYFSVFLCRRSFSLRRDKFATHQRVVWQER